MFGLWIQRSGSAALHYKLDFHNSRRNENFRYPLLKLIGEQNRWQTIEINTTLDFTSGYYSGVGTFRVQLTDMALLRVLLIRCPMIAPSRLDLSKWRNLQHLSLEPIHGSAWRATSSTIISQELTVLNLWIKRECCLQDCICCLDVLKACPKVEWFGLGMMRADESQSNNFQSEINGLSSVTLPN